VGLGALVLDCLIQSADPAIENCFHRGSRARWGVARLRCVRRGIPGVWGQRCQALFVPTGLWPCGHDTK
jgi:hypothetical protein